MIRHSTRKELWRNIYQDWRASGVNRGVYYQTELKNKWPSNIPFPCVSEFYRQLRKVEVIELPVAATHIQASPLSDCQQGNLRVVEVSQEQLLQTQIAVSQGQTTARHSISNEKIWRMRLPNGTMIEFETDQPEALAMQMASLAWRSA